MGEIPLFLKSGGTERAVFCAGGANQSDRCFASFNRSLVHWFHVELYGEGQEEDCFNNSFKISDQLFNQSEARGCGVERCEMIPTQEERTEWVRSSSSVHAWLAFLAFGAMAPSVIFVSNKRKSDRRSSDGP